MDNFVSNRNKKLLRAKNKEKLGKRKQHKKDVYVKLIKEKERRKSKKKSHSSNKLYAVDNSYLKTRLVEYLERKIVIEHDCHGMLINNTEKLCYKYNTRDVARTTSTDDISSFVSFDHHNNSSCYCERNCYSGLKEIIYVYEEMHTI